MVYVRINAGDYAETVAGIEQKWDSFFPDQPFAYFFLDDRISSLYTTDRTSGNIYSVFTVLAILIACVGLFGLAAFTAEQRTREISIRKVQGASVHSIVWKLTSGFTRLILISFILSVLPALWAMNRWLANFEFHTAISPLLFVYAGMIALVIAFITIFYHALRSANMNPADILRYE
jgi:putative ABC transport system permease protein